MVNVWSGDCPEFNEGEGGGVFFLSFFPGIDIPSFISDSMRVFRKETILERADF